jgi:hypothetical protein
MSSVRPFPYRNLAKMATNARHRYSHSSSLIQILLPPAEPYTNSFCCTHYPIYQTFLCKRPFSHSTSRKYSSLYGSVYPTLESAAFMTVLCYTRSIFFTFTFLELTRRVGLVCVAYSRQVLFFFTFILIQNVAQSVAIADICTCFARIHTWMDVYWQKGAMYRKARRIHARCRKFTTRTNLCKGCQNCPRHLFCD